MEDVEFCQRLGSIGGLGQARYSSSGECSETALREEGLVEAQ